jgi:hypothetical protein
MKRHLRSIVRYRPIFVPLRGWLYGQRLRRRLPRWPQIMGGRHLRDASMASAKRKRVLVATSTGGHLAASTLDSALAVALALRGAEVEVLLCDAALPVCMLCESHIFPDQDRLLASGPKPLCGHCYGSAASLYEQMGIPVRTLSSVLTEADRERARHEAMTADLSHIERFTFEGLEVGSQALAGTLRFYAVGNLDREPKSEPVLRRYLEAAILTAIAARRLYADAYDAVVLHHAIYVPQGVLAQAARDAGVRVVTWNTAYRAGCFLFSHGDTYHFTMMDEPQEEWSSVTWTKELRDQTIDYLMSRWTGSRDWISYQSAARPGFTAADYGLDDRRPIIGLMTNVTWDAQLYYASNAFPSMRDWVLDTIRWFASRPDLQLVVRIHPAELLNPLVSRQRVADDIAEAFSELPANVRVIAADDPLNTYALADACDSVLIYGTKMGVELAPRGIPVIVAGEAWIRNKGIAQQADTREQYFALLDSLPAGRRLDEAQQERALKYAFHFFFRRMIPLQFVRARSGWPPFEIAANSLDALKPEACAGLDIVCRGILEGAPFLWEHDDHGAADRTMSEAA